MLRVVTAFTPDYSELAERLAISCDKYGVPISAVPFESRGCWAANNAFKPTALLQTMLTFGDDCLWLDADMYLCGWPYEWPAGDILLKFSDPPEAQVFDFALGCNVPNSQTKLTPWGGHILFRNSNKMIEALNQWQITCNRWGTKTNDEQCLMPVLERWTEPAGPLTIGPFDPSFIVHKPAGRAHGKPTAAEGWI